MSDVLSLILKAILDQSSLDDIKKEIAESQSALSPLKVKVQVDDKYFKQSIENLNEITKNFSSKLDIDPKLTNFTTTFKQEIDKVGQVTQKAIQNIANLRTETGETIKIVENLGKETKETFVTVSSNTEKTEKAIDKLIAKQVKFLQEINKYKDIPQLREQFLSVQDSILGLDVNSTQEVFQNVRNQIDDLKASYKSLIAENKEFFKDSKAIYDEQEKSLKRIHSLNLERVKAEKKGYTELSSYIKSQIDQELKQYEHLKQQTQLLGLYDEKRDIELQNLKKVHIDELNKLKAKGLDISRQETQEIEKQIRNFKTEINLKSQQALVDYKKYINKEALSNVLDQVQLLDPNSIFTLDEAKSKIGDLRTEFGKVVKEARIARTEHTYLLKEQDNIFNRLIKNTGKMATWAIAGTAIFGTLRQIKQGVSYINELDKALNDIRIVTGRSQEEVEKLAISYNKLAKEMSVTTREIASTSADLYRQGLSELEVDERMKSIIQYAKISSLSLQESNTLITAAANATDESVKKIIDVYAMLGDMTASGAEEVGEAMQRVASAAKNSNISLERSAAWLATISSVTRERASTIGRSLNSIISRYESIKERGFNEEDATRINDVTKALASIGINPTINGQLRDLSEVMDEIGQRWYTLSKNERAYIATTMAGTYQRNRFITLMNNYDEALRNYEYALNSAGAAQQKFEIYQESTAAKIDRVKSAWEDFWQSSLSSDSIKRFLDTLAFLIDTLGNLPTVVAYAVTALALWKGSAISAKIATEGLSFAIKSLFVAFAGANPIGLALLGATIVFTTLQIAVEKVTRSAEEQKQAFQELSNSIKSLRKEIDDTTSLVSQYEQLIAKTNKTAEEKEKLLEVTQQLGSAFDDAITAVDAEGRVIEVDIQYIKQLIKAKEELIKVQKEELASRYGSLGVVHYSDITKANQRVREIEQDIEERLAQIQKLQETTLIPDEDKSIYIEKHRKRIQELATERRELVQQIQETQYTLAQEAHAFNEVNDSVNKLSYSFINQLLKATAQAGKEFKDFNELIEVFQSSEGYKVFKQLTKAMNEGIEEAEVDEVLGNLKELLNSFGVDAELTTQLVDAFDRSLLLKNSDEFLNDLSEMNTSLKQYQSQLSKSAKNISSVKRALDEYNESGRFSFETILDLAETYEQLLLYLDDEVALRNELTSIIKQEQEASKETYRLMLLNSQEYYRNKILLDEKYRTTVEENLSKIISAYESSYKVDLENYTSLANAKLEIESTLLKTIAKSWKNYYDSQGNFLGRYYTEINGNKSWLDNWAVGDFFYDQEGNLVRITDEMKKEMSAYLSLVNDLSAAFNEVANKGVEGVDFSKFGLDKASGKGDTPDKSLVAYYEALIRAINAQAQLTEEKSKAVKTDIDIAKSHENYALQLSKTNELLSLQERQIKELQAANSALKKEYASFASTSGFNVANWLDEQGEATVAFEKQYLASSKAVQEKMKETFEILQKLKQAWIANNESIKTLNDSLIETARSLTEIQEALENFNYQNALDEYSKVMDEFSRKLKKLDLDDLFISESNLDAKADIIRQKMAIVADQIASIQNKLKSIENMDISKSQKEDLFKQWSDDLANAVENYQSLQEALAKNAQAKLNIIQSIERTIMNMIKQSYQEELKLEEEVHRKRIDNLNELKDAYNEIIRAKIEALEQEKETNSYNEKINKLQEQRNKLQQQYDALLLDNTNLAQFQRAELQKQIAEIDKELQQTIYEHGIDYRRKSLEKELDLYNKAKDEEIDTEEEAYNNYKKIMEQKMSDENLYFEARMRLSQQSTQSLINDLIAYTDKFGEGMSLLGDSIKKNLIDNLRIAVNELANIPALLDQINSSTSKNPFIDSAIGTISNPPSYSEKRKVYGNEVDLANAISILGTKNFEYIYDTSPDPSKLTSRDILVGGYEVFSNWNELQKVKGLTVLYGANREETKKAIQNWARINGYAEGGVNVDTGLAMLHGTKDRPEVIFNAAQASKLYAYVKALPSPSEIAKSLAQIKTQMMPALASSSYGKIGDINVEINVEGNLDRTILPEIKTAVTSSAERIMKELHKIGVHINK